MRFLEAQCTERLRTIWTGRVDKDLLDSVALKVKVIAIQKHVAILVRAIYLLIEGNQHRLNNAG